MSSGGGVRCIFSKWFIGITFDGKVKIGCQTKTFSEWDKWFKTKEEFQTKRDTSEFKRIYAHYVAIKAYKKELDKK